MFHNVRDRVLCVVQGVHLMLICGATLHVRLHPVLSYD